MSNPDAGVTPGFARRTWFQFAVAALLFLAWQLADVLLLAFGAVVVAAVLRTLADPIARRTPLGDKASLAAAVLIILGVFAGAGWLFGATVSQQVEALVQRLPRSPAELQALLRTLPMGDLLAEQARGLSGLVTGFQGVAGRVGGYAVNAVSAMANLLLVLVAGAFLAVRPSAARDGLLLLAPKNAVAPLREALDASGLVLRRWVFGTFADMVVVGVLTTIGTAVIGLPSPVALGIFAALVSIVPIVGPIISVIPALLLAAQSGTELVVWTVVVYVAVQQVESNLIYPFIQRRATNLPPVLTLFGLVTFGVLFGPLGVVLATPLVAVLMTLTQRLYVRNTLGKSAASETPHPTPSRGRRGASPPAGRADR